MLTLTKARTYVDLNATFLKGLRNGNWRKLKFLDKALFRAAMGFAKGGKSIVNGLLVEKLLGLAARLKEILKGMRIFKFRRGFERAAEMLENGEEKGVFVWAPRVKRLVERPGLYLLVGDGAVVRNE